MPKYYVEGTVVAQPEQIIVCDKILHGLDRRLTEVVVEHEVLRGRYKVQADGRVCLAKLAPGVVGIACRMEHHTPILMRCVGPANRM